MDIYSSRIKKIEYLSESNYKVEINITNISEIDKILVFEDDEANFILHGYNYEFIIENNAMQPLGEANECMEVFHQNEICENLNPTLRRQWAVASIIVDIAGNLITNTILRVYRSD